MNTSTILTVVSIVVLVTFAVWALGPVLAANRQRILKSPATWLVMILCCAFLWLRWEEASIGKQQIAERDRCENLSAVQRYNFNMVMKAQSDETARVLRDGEKVLQQYDKTSR